MKKYLSFLSMIPLLTSMGAFASPTQANPQYQAPAMSEYNVVNVEQKPRFDQRQIWQNGDTVIVTDPMRCPRETNFQCSVRTVPSTKEDSGNR
jgi:hypothetical protein